MGVTAKVAPPLRAVTDTEDDVTTVAHLCRVMDLALLKVNDDVDPTPGDIEALSYLSGLIEPAARRLMGDFNALHDAGVFATVKGLRAAQCA